MSFFRKNLIMLFLILLVYAWFFLLSSQTQNKKPLQVLGANSNVALFTQPEAGSKPITDAINSAQKEVLVEVYLLSDKDIIQSLEDAKKRGVAVDVMLEEHPFGGGTINNKTEAALTENGVNFKWTNSAYTLTHEKAIVIDNRETFILNQNLTASSFSKNREYDILDTNPEDVAQVRDVFISDWDRKSYTVNSNSHIIESPETSRRALTTLIQGANKSIDIEIEDIDDDSIVSLLSEKAKTIPVRLIVPSFTQIRSNQKAVTALSKAGASVKILTSPYIHAKLIIADGANAYVGSVNLSSQSMDKNRELGIILSQPDIINSMAQDFEQDFQKGKAL